MRVVDLRSDTVTRPTPEMRAAMFAAELGDDVLGDDPTVKRLEAAAARISGKEAAIFLPSGTMANQVAIACHTRPGDEIVMETGAHPFNHEAGGAAAISGAQIKLVEGAQGLLSVDGVRRAIRTPDDHHPVTTLLCVEDTSNRGGGTVYPLETLDALADLAHANGMAAHMDGARAFNAVVASEVPLARRVSKFDTVSFCLSKGLGAPVGSMLCGPAALLVRARRIRKMLGGGMRQSGLLAAAGLYALEHHVERLAQDHGRARELSMGLLLDGNRVQLPQTNMVYVDVADAPAVQDRLAGLGVLCFAVSADRLRLVVHLDVDDAGIEATVQAFRALRG